MANSANFKARLLLEGREVPFISANIVASPGSPQVCSIDMVPHETIKSIQPKTQVQIFVRDTMVFPDGRFYLAFDGEVASKGYAKSHDGRSFNITAMDYSVYWDEAKAYYYNPNFMLGKMGDVVAGAPSPATTAQAVGAKTVVTLTSFQSQMIKVITGQSDLVAGVVKVLQTLGLGNQYLKAANSRLKIVDRIGLYSAGNVKTFLKELNIEAFLGQLTGAMGGLVSIRSMLMEVMGTVFHEFMSVPFPPYFQKTNSVGGYLFIPDTYSSPPPKCNVVFPNSIISMDFRDDFRAAPTRFGYQASLPEYIAGAINRSVYPISFYPKSFYNYMYKSRTDLGDEAGSLLDSSTIMAGYASLAYGNKRTGETYLGPTLREMDFLTNEEAIRGIFYEQETFPPGVTALAKTSAAGSRNSFVNSIGQYLFFKKKFSARNGSATLRFSPHIAPGLNGVLIDDSSAGQTIIAKFQSVTHIINNSSALTTVQLGYARDFDELDAISGGTGDPPVPPWFDSSIFGKVDKALFDAETKKLVADGAITDSEAVKRKKVKKPITYPSISKFYQSILGCDSITNSTYPSTRGAVSSLIAHYRGKAGGKLSKDEYTAQLVRRPLATMGQAMLFLGAAVKGVSLDGKRPVAALDDDIPSEYSSFAATGGSLFDGSGVDKVVLNIRREIIDSYIEALKRGAKEGFRG